MIGSSLFHNAIRAARLADPISPEHRRVLENPPAGAFVDPIDAAADGYVGLRGEVNVAVFARFVLAQHDRRIAIVDAALAALRDRTPIDADKIESLARAIAGFRRVPDRLASALELRVDPAPSVAADRLERELMMITREAQRNRPARIL